MKTTLRLLILVGLFAVAVPAATATTGPINPTQLSGGASSTWDPQNPNSWTMCDDLPTNAYTPVEDGSIGTISDAFDGGLMLSVGGRETAFVDGDGQGTLNATSTTITVGPEDVNGLQVTTTARAVGGTAAVLRYLVTLRNPDPVNPVTREVELASDLGSDRETLIAATSSGDTNLTANDRTLITTDGPPFDDPIVAHVFYGPGTPSTTIGNVVIAPASLPDQEDCLMVDFPVTIAPGKTKHLLFFVELTSTSGSDPIATAVQGLRKFRSQTRLENAGLLKGIDPKRYKHILNWTLIPPR